ncbi:MAG: circularly permuted type 2 ATP-grasp protein [Marinibacterium sp.]
MGARKVRNVQQENNAAPLDDRPAAADLIGGYAPPNGVADELLRRDGAMRPVWQPFLDHLARILPEALALRIARGDQYLHDAGVYYRQYSDTGSTQRDWPLSHVPVIISADEWAGLADGIAQRADLLERVMADLYGPADLVRDGSIPARLIAQNPEWLRPLVGVAPKSGHYLHVLAFEIGRSPDGGWFVLGDRTQAPSGAGFALENRMATARVFADFYAAAHIERLAGFFGRFRSALQGLRTSPQDRVGILTPGQHTDTYFEHAYIARYLGVTLLECDDLKVVDGRLMVQTINGLEPLGVLWRRLDSRFADPLELDEDSTLGTPGMVGTLRAGSVSMLNSLGSGILETRALMAFLPRICEQLLGTPLKLPNIATWWCGQSSERDYVRNNLQRMMIGPALSTRLPFDIDASTALGGKFRNAAKVPVADWLDSEGAGLVGQEAVSLSTTPAMIDGRLEPRPVIVRVFAARTPDGWTVMPGGYARIGRSDDPTALAMQHGGSVADVWVVGDTEVARPSIARPDDTPFMRRLPGRLPARAADNLFWLGRYVERADFSLRALRAYHLRRTEIGPVATPLLARMADYLDQRGHDLDAPIPDSLTGLLDQARGCAEKVRDRFSTDGWSALDELAETARNFRAQPEEDGIHDLTVLLRKLAGFTGLVYDNMFRFAGWRFLTMGRSLERAILMTEMLAAFSGTGAPPGSYEMAIEVGDSTMTHRRRYSIAASRNTVVDLLALDTDNPRSVMYQISQLKAEQMKIPRRGDAPVMTGVSRAILLLETRLAVAVPESLGTEDFHDMVAQMRSISDGLRDLYFG